MKVTWPVTPENLSKKSKWSLVLATFSLLFSLIFLFLMVYVVFVRYNPDLPYGPKSTIFLLSVFLVLLVGSIFLIITGGVYNSFFFSVDRKGQKYWLFEGRLEKTIAEKFKENDIKFERRGPSILMYFRFRLQNGLIVDMMRQYHRGFVYENMSSAYFIEMRWINRKNLELAKKVRDVLLPMEIKNPPYTKYSASRPPR